MGVPGAAAIQNCNWPIAARDPTICLTPRDKLGSGEPGQSAIRAAHSGPARTGRRLSESSIRLLPQKRRDLDLVHAIAGQRIDLRRGL